MNGSHTVRVGTSMALLALLAAGCGDDPQDVGSQDDIGGDERSVEAYCETFYTDGAELRRGYQDLDFDNDPARAVIALLGAPQEVASFFADLAVVAPEEIASDVEILQEAMERTSDSLGDAATDPIGGMIDAIAAGAATTGAEARVNAYTLDNCGPPPVSVNSPEASSSPSQASAPEPGDAVLSVSTDGLIVLDMSTDMIAMMSSIDGQPGIRTYDLAGNLVGESLDIDSLDPDCKFAITRRSDGINVIFTVQTTDIPAQGVEAAQVRQTLTASDATTFEPLWSVEIALEEAGDIYCSPGASTGNDLTSRIWFTSDGRWALTTLSTVEAWLIDLESGDRHVIPDAGGDTTSVSGSHVIVNTSDLFGEGEINVIDPATTEELASTDVLSVLRSELYPVNDELVVATSDRTVNEGSGVTQVLSLPGLESLWQDETLGKAGAILEAETGTLVLDGDYLVAVEPRSGERIWERDEDLTLCAAAAGVVMVSVNQQIAYLDAKTGEQVRYDPERSDCPTMLTDTYGYEVQGQTWTVFRVL